MIDSPATRRHLLRLAAGSGLVAALPRAAPAATPAAMPLLLPADAACVLTPEVTEGPFYIDPRLLREDITEGRPGAPLAVRLQVVDAACRPLAGARVDLWHCDAAGLYSGFEGQGDARAVSTAGQHFLRGTALADEDGIARFGTIWPGWYRGRAPHIHFKVFIDEARVLTGQMFFPDALSEFLYRHVAAYGGRTGRRDTLNQDDGIARQAGETSFAQVKELTDRYQASLLVAVDPDAHPVEPGPGPGFPPGPPPGDRPGAGGPPPGPPPGGPGRGDGSLVPGIPGLR